MILTKKMPLFTIIFMAFQLLSACHLRIRNFTEKSVSILLFNDATNNVLLDSEGIGQEGPQYCYRIPAMTTSNINYLLLQGFSAHHVYVLFSCFQKCGEPFNLEKAIRCYPVDYRGPQKWKDSEELEINIFPSCPLDARQASLVAPPSYKRQFSVACYLYNLADEKNKARQILPTRPPERLLRKACCVLANCFNASTQCQYCMACFAEADSVSGYQSVPTEVGTFRPPRLAIEAVSTMALKRDAVSGKIDFDSIDFFLEDIGFDSTKEYSSPPPAIAPIQDPSVARIKDVVPDERSRPSKTKKQRPV